MDSKTYLPQHMIMLMRVCTSVFNEDNEKNANLALGILEELYKTFLPTLMVSGQLRVQETAQRMVQEFTSLFIRQITRFEQLVEKMYDERIPFNEGTQLRPSTCSFLALNNGPRIIILLTQINFMTLDQVVKNLIPPMLKALNSNPPMDARQKMNPARQRIVHQHYALLIKFYTLVVFVLRKKSSKQLLLKYKKEVCIHLLDLLNNSQTIAMRRELLQCMRQIFALQIEGEGSDKLPALLEPFAEKLNLLLNENLLIGEHPPPTSHPEGTEGFAAVAMQKAEDPMDMRPIVYPALADLISKIGKCSSAHEYLSMERIQQIVYIFSRSLNDPTLPLSVQDNSARLLFVLLDLINRTQKDDPNALKTMKKILVAVVRKFESLSRIIPRLLKQVKAKEERYQQENPPAKPVEKDGKSESTDGRKTSGSRDSKEAKFEVKKPQEVLGRRPKEMWIPAHAICRDSVYPERVLELVQRLLLFMFNGLKLICWYILQLGKHQAQLRALAQLNQPQTMKAAMPFETYTWGTSSSIP